MLRITQFPAVRMVTIVLEGKLLGPWLDEVRTAVDAAQRNGAVRLDLQGLQFADHAGVEYLNQLRSAGIELLHCTAFIESLLATALKSA
jgi:anti-anti-sigma regulatory factor